LLDAAAPLVAAGGLLVYATCTLEPEENAQQVAEFLERHRDFRLDPSFAVASRFLDAAGHLAVLPHHTGFDGAFAARFRRAA
jgi:16S rRNA (cytosine967-C5)-methyltransferase